MSEVCEIPCFACGTYLRSFDTRTNHPMGGVELTTRGHYGCSVIDAHMGVVMAINICDDCLKGRTDAILAYDDGTQKPRKWAATSGETPNGGNRD